MSNLVPGSEDEVGVYQDSQPSVPSIPKGNSKFEILLVKTFSLKQKRKSNTSSYYRKNQTFTLQKSSPLNEGLQCKKSHSDRFRHIQA